MPNKRTGVPRGSPTFPASSYAVLVLPLFFVGCEPHEPSKVDRPTSIGKFEGLTSGYAAENDELPR